MAVKYIKDHKTQETVYPITKSDCIIDAFSINDLEIDKLFEDSLSVSKHQNGMYYLNLQGLIHYHSKIKDYFNNIPKVDLSDYATEAYVDQEIANLDIPILNNTKIKEEIVDNTDGVYYFTTDTKEIYRNGEKYGGNVLNYKKSFVFGDYIYLDGYYVKDSEVITVTNGVYDESTETITVL